MNPSDEGTLITKESPIKDFKAVAAKDGITAIKVKSSNMLLAYGFVRKVFEIFESWKTPIDMIATSEVAISLTIDSTCHLEDIKKTSRNTAQSRSKNLFPSSASSGIARSIIADSRLELSPHWKIFPAHDLLRGQ